MIGDNARKIFTGCALCYHSCGMEVTVKDGKVVKVRGPKIPSLKQGKALSQGRSCHRTPVPPGKAQISPQEGEGGMAEDHMGSGPF